MNSVIQKLKQADNVLLMTHLRPDGDALGSVFGLAEYLRGNGKQATVLLPDGMPARYSALCQDYVSDLTEEELEKFDTFVSADCANVPRLGLPSGTDVEFFRARNFLNIDHHENNSIQAGSEYVDPLSPSNTVLLTEIMRNAGGKITEKCATLLLMGLMTDTGTFCFANTDARAFRTAAFLEDSGAKIDDIANAVFFSKSVNQLKFEAEMTSGYLHLSPDGRIAWAYAAPELESKYRFKAKEDEGLIDIVRSIDTAVIAVLVSKIDGGFRISMRSKNALCPVGDAARHFGGGGHLMAAGATIENVSSAESAMEQVLPELEKLLKNLD